MLDFRERSRVRRAVYAKPTIAILLVLTVITLRGAWGMYEKNQEAEINSGKAVADLKRLETRQTELKNDIDRLSSTRGQEEEIRNRFMVAKDGEKVIIVTQPEGQTLHTVTVSGEATQTFFEKLKAAVGASDE